MWCLLSRHSICWMSHPMKACSSCTLAMLSGKHTSKPSCQRSSPRYSDHAKHRHVVPFTHNPGHVCMHPQQRALKASANGALWLNRGRGAASSAHSNQVARLAQGRARAFATSKDGGHVGSFAAVGAPKRQDKYSKRIIHKAQVRRRVLFVLQRSALTHSL